MAGYGYHGSAQYNMSRDEEIYDEWGYHDSVNVSVDFLLPTGIYIPLDVPRNDTIKQVKQLLWEEAIHHPLFNQLQNQDSYTFVYITSTGIQEEITDERRHLSEFDLIHELPVLKLIQSQGNIEEKRIIHEIHQLAGIKNENDLNVDAESRAFRKEMREEAIKVSIRRSSLHWKVLLENHYPPTIIPHLNEKTHTRRDYGLIQLKYENTDNSYTIKVNPQWFTFDLISEAIQTWDQKAKSNLPSTNPDDYVLKSDGKEFIVGNYQIYMFKCLRSAMVAKREKANLPPPQPPPILTMLHVASVRKLLPESHPGIQVQPGNYAPPVPDKRRQTCSLWQLDMQFSVRVLRAGNINANIENNKKLVVHVGVYHGTEALCPTVYTKEPKKEMTGGEFDWDEVCFFDTNTCNLPRNSKLCITICTMSKTKTKSATTKKKDNNQKNSMHNNATPIAYVNMTMFDFKANLKTGLYRLHCWLWPENVDSNNLHPRGGVTMNPDTEQAPFLEILLPEYDRNPLVQYPPQEKVLEQAAFETSTSSSSIYPSPSKSHIAQLAAIVEKDRFDDLFDNDKNLLWYLRLDCRENWPEALSKVLCAVKWNNYKNVALAQAMLGAWPPLEPDRAMELLDGQFADEKVRDFAVRCLKQLRDDELQSYLMQLVQVLKFDSYLNSSLVRFLLERAWNNRKIGHFLFWHLRAEITNTTLNLRFSLILEAYLYGNIPHMKMLYKQFDALNKMRALNERVKSQEFSQKDVKVRARKALQETANQESFAEALSYFEDPLEPNVLLGKPIIEKMKVMNSKMRPLWLVFQDAEETVQKHRSVIYKNGDDLRQDMLTLQIISIMDMLWKADGLDLRMIPYGCLATGGISGMIEVVTESNTIANIQKSKTGKMHSAFRHQTLFEWIEDKNPTKPELDQAIENFTYSCAGYCVATYVLGVGDRHSDNIMVREKGQLFHIDFGHILGNFKSKYGIKRERVPFVLAHDFVHVINKGKTNAKEEFQYFRKLCDRAFCILRKKGHLFITLFALMLHSGLPELTSLNHLEYLRETLALHLTEEKAIQQFRNKFNKALTDAWSTSINWFFHNVAKDNK
uniref:Phosphatidylinositol 4,5-bisphosphate 3-kinase catalytic subunit beta isoform-like n=1 Tax=Phallusia mammillata TaxID=59560 RepID=A0A6F9DP17_9ASCI|nr:phosphatidylinositol 4,5-bisphosphate 3-kinase catalytic subunit beta isoform-like [Phallusia mammillata]